jgi:ATP synthase F1 complex assembly factor 2
VQIEEFVCWATGSLTQWPRSRSVHRIADALRAAEGLQIYLDSRPVRTPSKDILSIPHSKPHLASAIALEWDLLVTAHQALKHHLIPLTSLATRAEDFKKQDARGEHKTRNDVVAMVMRYLDTDTILCWAPESSSSQILEMEQHASGAKRESLRDVQIKTAQLIIAYLTTHVWPGAEIHPVMDSDSIVPRSQPQMTKDIIRGWITGLPAYELAGLERAVLAGKGLLGAARLVVEWSPVYRHLRGGGEASQKKRYGIEEAARAASLEVAWQTGIWGEVEDTHDVEKEDLKRQLGSVILLVADEEI